MGREPLLPPFPGHAWIGYWEHVPANAPRVVIHRRQVAHSLMYLASGDIDVRWVKRGVERRYHRTAGAIRFDPATQEHQSFVSECNPAHSFYTLLIPPAHLHELAASDEIDDPVMSRHVVVSDDVELRWCISRLSSPVVDGDERGSRQEEAARRLVLRLHRLCRGRGPQWQADGSPFDRVTMQRLRDCLDAHLRVAPSLSDMAMHVGLSPSHFAKKFRQSTGLSLLRFVNRRRVAASIGLLQANADTLAGIALDLGFASQSHFTRIFNEMTGMTPAKYRGQFRRTVGYRGPSAGPASPPRPP